MKKNYLAIAVAALTLTLTACDSKSESQKTEDKPAAQATASTTANQASSSTSSSADEMKNISYLLGFNFGKNLEPTHIKGFDADQILAGLNDALAGKETKLSKEEMQQTIAALQQLVQKSEAEQARAYEEKGKAFLAENAKRDGVITTKSGLQYEIVTKGTGAKPTKDDVVEVNYEGKLVDGKVFDSSIQRGKPVEFAVGSVIPGWVEALQLMQVGEKVKIYVPSELAYGAEGFPPVIPANSVLIFDVELLNIKKPDPKAAKPDSKQEAAKPAAKK